MSSLFQRAIPLALFCGVSVSLLSASIARGQAMPSAASSTGATTSSRTLHVTRITGTAPRIDGKLDDAAWASASDWTSHFVQREPRQNEPATDPTEATILFDDDAIYIAARLKSSTPDNIRALVSRRDREETSEQFVVSLDTYHDRRTAYTFAITAAGVRIDYYHPSDFEGRREYTFDPVWEGRAHIDATGWTAELRIPFTQLRFADADVQTWGINLVRLIPATNEEDFWVLVKRDDTGWSSRMGELVGIQGTRKSRRIEVVPYAATDATMASTVDKANPFAEKLSAGYRVGADLKVGLGSSFTLDATFNPDFGQVEADPAEVNLSGFETIFSERRPFFLEGTQLFNGRGNFYSRRIGAPPPGFGGGTFRDAPVNSTILGAAKLSGRLPSGVSAGVLSALTAQETASNYDTTTRTFGSAIIAPRTLYNVVSAQKEFGRNSSTANLMLTSVDRDLPTGSPMTTFLARHAYSGISDVRLRWGGGMYDASAFAGFSLLQGDSLAMIAQQRSNRRFYQRPDATHFRVDSSLTSFSGYYTGINHSKLSGKHWLWDIDLSFESPNFELNDIGRLGSSDDQVFSADIVYRETTPNAVLRNYNVGFAEFESWNFAGDGTGHQVQLFGNLTFANFWSAALAFNRDGSAYSDNLARGGPMMIVPGGVSMSAGFGTNAASRRRLLLDFSAGRDDLGGWRVNPSATVTARVGSRLELRAEPRFSANETRQQYVTTRNDGRAVNYGGRYVFAALRRSELAVRLRANFALTPRSTIESYFEPFASTGQYDRFGELRAPRELALRAYGTDGTTISAPDANGRRAVVDGASAFTLPNLDFNVKSFRSNVVFRSEWRPGSTLFLVWQQNRSANDPARTLVRPSNLLDALSAPGSNFFSAKVSFWLPVK